MAASKRKAHNKSRLGCKNCKARKIKCDVKKPSCSNCIRRQVDCDFCAVGTPQLGVSPTGLNITDLELLHNYTTTTYKTLLESPTIREFYRNTVVQVGFNCDYIMRGVLALSGLHLAHHRPRIRDHYLLAAITHHQAASQTTIPLVPGATPQNAQLLFLFSVLTTDYGACVMVFGLTANNIKMPSALPIIILSPLHPFLPVTNLGPLSTERDFLKVFRRAG